MVLRCYMQATECDSSSLSLLSSHSPTSAAALIKGFRRQGRQQCLCSSEPVRAWSLAGLQLLAALSLLKLERLDSERCHTHIPTKIQRSHANHRCAVVWCDSRYEPRHGGLRQLWFEACKFETYWCIYPTFEVLFSPQDVACTFCLARDSGCVQ